MDQVKRVRVGFIGMGRWAKVLSQKMGDNFELICCTNRESTEDRDWFLDRYLEIEHVESVDNLVCREDVDLVMVATPIETHYRFSKMALESGKHVFVEKPMTGDFELSSDLRDLASKSGKQIFVDYTFLFSDVFSQLKRRIDNNLRTSMYFNWLKYGSFRERIDLNLLSHELSLLIGLGFSGISVDSKVMEEDYLFLRLSGKPDLRASVLINRVSPEKLKLVRVEQRGADFLWNGNDLFRNNNGKKLEKIFSGEREPLEAAMLALWQSIVYNVQSETLDIAVSVDKLLSELRSKNGQK